jgi:3-hydroxybutyryl-CoA dehydrogenase
MLEAGLATVEWIDEAMRRGGFPLGPFELMDLVGIDVNLAAASAVWEGLGRPERLRPSTIQRELVAGGDLGRKTGRGFYLYDGATRTRNPAVPTPRALSMRSIDAGAIVDRILAAIDAEARDAVAHGVANSNDIDLAMRAGAGHPVGPFERAAQSDS